MADRMIEIRRGVFMRQNYDFFQFLGAKSVVNPEGCEIVGFRGEVRL